MKSEPIRGRSDSNSNNINLVIMDTNSKTQTLHGTDLEAGTGMSDTDSLMCAACDPSSLIPHEMHISRFRIANLCCAGEGKWRLVIILLSYPVFSILFTFLLPVCAFFVLMHPIFCSYFLHDMTLFFMQRGLFAIPLIP
jgi:hypothetical protein